jgi:hypothetical protein
MVSVSHTVRWSGRSNGRLGGERFTFRPATIASSSRFSMQPSTPSSRACRIAYSLA